MSTIVLEPGFDDAVHESQYAFRAALRAMSQPGTIQELKNPPALEALAPATYALCLTLLDGDTPVWLGVAFDTPAVRANLAFHCGCPIAGTPVLAAFALLTAADLHDLTLFNRGTDRDPDRSCTVIIQLPALEQGSATKWQGPGIENERVLHLPVPSEYWQHREAMTAFPQGLDAFFTAGERLAGLPRSTRVTHFIDEAQSCT